MTATERAACCGRRGPIAETTELPGGKSDEGEPAEQALARELHIFNMEARSSRRKDAGRQLAQRPEPHRLKEALGRN
jgi:hypothetical protein